MTAIELDRRSLISAAKKGEINVTFKKKDGTTRKMRCTLNNELAPEVATMDKLGGDQRGVLTVFDLDVKGFRSFRLDSLKSAKAA